MISNQFNLSVHRVLSITDKSFKMSYTPEGKNEKLQDDEISFVNKEEMNQKSRNLWETEKSIFNRQFVFSYVT